MDTLYDAKTVIKKKLACVLCEQYKGQNRVCKLKYDELPVLPDCRIRKMLRMEKE